MVETVKIQTIELQDVGGIQHLKLENVNRQMNIICGENGVGKTTLLDSIGHIFTNQHTNVLKKNVQSERAIIRSNILDDNENSNYSELFIDTHKPSNSCYIQGFGHYSKKLILLKVDRTFHYQMLNSINKDEAKDEGQTAHQSMNGIGYHDIKGWFLHRHLYSAHSGALQPEQIHNFELSKRCFSILNEHFSFSRVDPNENEIMINTPSGEVYYEYLSSGFKSIISIVFGIIKEIELRFKNPFLCADQFDGIIEIDEIELHLHPEWQGKACSILKEIFPLAQFFITTHSPHVVQTASQGEVIALERKDDRVLQRELPNSEYGYQGWTVEEVLRDVMGMNDLRTEKYETIRNEFLQAFKNRNRANAETAFNKLEKMLHPNNELKTIYQMQLDSIGE
nr:AAA family ATPase [Acinetobacter lwoffii]